MWIVSLGYYFFFGALGVLALLLALVLVAYIVVGLFAVAGGLLSLLTYRNLSTAAARLAQACREDFPTFIAAAKKLKRPKNKAPDLDAGDAPDVH